VLSKLFFSDNFQLLFKRGDFYPSRKKRGDGGSAALVGGVGDLEESANQEKGSLSIEGGDTEKKRCDKKRGSTFGKGGGDTKTLG